MKQREFVLWLKQNGATFKDDTNHLKVYLNGKQTILPRHPSKELKTGLVETTKPEMRQALKGVCSMIRSTAVSAFF